MFSLGIRLYRIDFNRLVGLNESVTVRIGNIMSHKKFLVRIDIAKASVSDSVAASYFMMKLTIWSDFISIVVRTCQRNARMRKVFAVKTEKILQSLKQVFSISAIRYL